MCLIVLNCSLYIIEISGVKKTNGETDPAAGAPGPVPERIDDGQESFQSERDETVGGRHEEAPQRHLGEPETAQRLVGPLARRPRRLVVLKKRGQKEEGGDRGVYQALVDDVEIGDALAHRTIHADDDDDERVGQEPE